MTCRPISAPLLLVTPDAVCKGTIAVVDVTGFDETVTLAIDGLTAGVAATIDPNPVLPGENATLTLTAVAAPLGNSRLEITVSQVWPSATH